MNKQIWYTTKETATLLEVSEETIRRHIRNRLFPNARRKSPMPKSTYLIPEEDIRNYRHAAAQLDLPR